MTSPTGRRTVNGGRRLRVLLIAAALLVVGVSGASSQITYRSGQNIAPSFEGWMPNPDGTIDIYFGYFNRNFEEHLHIPVGPDNHLQRAGPARGLVRVSRRRRGGCHRSPAVQGVS